MKTTAITKAGAGAGGFDYGREGQLSTCRGGGVGGGVRLWTWMAIVDMPRKVGGLHIYLTLPVAVDLGQKQEQYLLACA